MADNTDALALLVDHLRADPVNRTALLRDPERMAAVAADIAPADPSLRTALRAVVDSGAGTMLTGDRHPGPQAVQHLVARLQSHGVSEEAARRCVALLETAYFGHSMLPMLPPTPPPPSEQTHVDLDRLWPEEVRHERKRRRNPLLVILAAVAAVVIMLVVVSRLTDGPESPPPSPSSSPSPSVTPSPSSTPTPSPTPSTVLEPWQNLAARINPQKIQANSCRKGPDAGSASVLCSLTTSSPSTLYVQTFADRRSMDAQYRKSVPNPQDVTCPPGGTTWHRTAAPDVALGDLACYASSDGALWVAWTVWDDLTLMVAGGRGGSLDERYSWWESNSPTLLVSR